ncbi:MAG: radical SAM protein [Myxococcales bacterium]|nr:radical SAM protein [Myxococcales bacterium]
MNDRVNERAGHDVRRLDLFVTEACNLACDYCFAATRPRRSPSAEQARARIDWLMRSSAARVHITWWGGEPLLRKDLLRELGAAGTDRAAAVGKRVSFSMPTNASLIDDETKRWLEQVGVQVFLSIDGDERGQATRPLKAGGSSHALVQIGMRRALDTASRQGPPAIRMTVSPDNAAAQAAGVRYFLDHGARELLIYAATDQDWTPRDLEAFVAGQREVAEVFVELVETSARHEDIANFKAWRPILRRLARGVPARPRSGALRSCGVGRELIGVTVEGAFTPCHRVVFYDRRREVEDDYAPLDLGDLERGLDEDAARVWSERRVEDRRGAARCVECEQFDLCTIGCVAVNYATTGDLDRVPEAACRLMGAQIEVCREIHERLAHHPHYRLYLGQPLSSAVASAASSIGARAWQLFQASGATT